MSKRYSVLVVDDSAFMRKLITDMIRSDERFSDVYTAKNGQEAFEKTMQLRPSVISMDVEMPVVDGIEALKRIMEHCPTPVIMLSSMTEHGAEETIHALESGAIDFVKKPSGMISLDLVKVKQDLLQKLIVAAQTNVFPQQLHNSGEMQKKTSAQRGSSAIGNDTHQHLVAIGTSTGGPKALQHVLSRFPAHFPAPILIVQHMPPPFTKSLAARLNSLCDIQVVEAEHGAIIKPGTAYIAPGDWHMTLVQLQDNYKIHLHQEPPCFGHRPSVDVMFRSLLPLSGMQKHIVLLTGMGRDGASAMKALKEAQARTIAEAEATCVVYGMPKAAVELGAAEEIVPIHRIAETIMNNMEKHVHEII